MCIVHTCIDVLKNHTIVSLAHMLLSYSNIWKKCCVCAAINGSVCFIMHLCRSWCDGSSKGYCCYHYGPPIHGGAWGKGKWSHAPFLFLVSVFFSAIFLGGVLQWSSITWPHCETGGAKGGHLVWGSAQLTEDPSLLRSSPLDAWTEECVLLPASSHAQGVHHKTCLWSVSHVWWLTSLTSKIQDFLKIVIYYFCHDFKWQLC